jgi:hypothetical protein
MADVIIFPLFFLLVVAAAAVVNWFAQLMTLMLDDLGPEREVVMAKDSSDAS